MALDQRPYVPRCPWLLVVEENENNKGFYSVHGLLSRKGELLRADRRPPTAPAELSPGILLLQEMEGGRVADEKSGGPRTGRREEESPNLPSMEGDVAFHGAAGRKGETYLISALH